MTGLIQGQDAVLSFFKNDWIPFVCSSDISISIAVTKAPVRTVGDGQWKKYAYQDSEYAVTLSGLLKFDADNWTGWDTMNAQFNFSNVLFRCSFEDDGGNIRTLQGYAMVETSTLSFSPGAIVKNDFQLQGSGRLDMFDGLIPCPTTIDSISVTGLSDPAGNIGITYTYTGDLYQVKYRLDGMGAYIYALGALPLTINGVTVGNHSIEIIPICTNSYEGTGLSQTFAVTQALVCTSVVTDITISTIVGSVFATAVKTGGATQMQWNLDGGFGIVAPITDQIPLSSLAPGNHKLTIVPLCLISGQLVPGTGFTKNFTVSSTPTQSIVNYNFLLSGSVSSVNQFQIYVNGVLMVNSNAAGTGSINVPIGATVRASLVCYIPGGPGTKHGELTVFDSTTATVLFDSTVAQPVSLQYNVVANGDSYIITQSISD